MMKRIISVMLVFLTIFTLPFSVLATNDYRDFVVEDLKPQWPIKTNRDFYLTAIDYYKSGSKHNGIDIGHNGGGTEEAKGEYIYPVEEGVVSACGWDDSMGWYVKITHTVSGKKYYSRYMHFLKDSIPSNIKKGVTVYRDTPIGRMGNTGKSDGTHLHFDIANTDSGTYEQLSKIRGYTFDYYINNPSSLKNVKFSGSWANKNGSKRSCYWNWILENSIKDGNDYLIHVCSKYETYNNVLGACKECHKKFDYSKIYTGDVAGLWIAKKNQNINLYSEPYEDAIYTSVKSGELEVRGYVKNAYGNKWYVISGDKNKTYYVYENTFKNLYTQDSHYYENDYHRYDSGAVIETPNTNNSGGNNIGLGNSIVGVVDIPSSWDNLSIRSGPSTNYQIVGSMNDGVQCTVYPDKTSNGWYYVHYNGVWGYASGKQIKINNSSASSQTSTSTTTTTTTSTSTSQPTSTPAPTEKQTITVSFDSNGGSTDYASQTVEKYGTATIPSKIPSKSGYEFLGWSTYRDVSTASYKSGETINVGNTNLTFYAIWKKQINKKDWDLSLSEDKLFFEKNYGTGQSVVISFYEPDGMRENIDYHLRINIDGLTYSWDDEWYDENGYKNQELTIYTPTKETYDEEVCIELIGEDNSTVIDSDSFYVYLTEKDTTTEKFADRNPSGISVYLNGKKLSFDVQPQIINSRTMVPMRKIFEELGTVVGWNNNTQRAISVKKGDVVSVSIGGQYLTVNGEQKLLDSPPVIISGRTLVPVRAVAESFNCDVEWYDYGASQVVDINMKDTINSMENIGSLLVGYSEFPPFSYYDDYENLIGFDTELAKYVCDFWGWECSFVEIPFDMKFVAINSGEIDCYWNGVTKTEEREEICSFTNDYISFDMEYEEDGEWYTSHEVYSVPFRKGDYDTVQLVNIALEEAQKDGTIEYLKYKYGIE